MSITESPTWRGCTEHLFLLAPVNYISSHAKRPVGSDGEFALFSKLTKRVVFHFFYAASERSKDGVQLSLYRRSPCSSGCFLFFLFALLNGSLFAPFALQSIALNSCFSRWPIAPFFLRFFVPPPPQPSPDQLTRLPSCLPASQSAGYRKRKD